MYAIRHYTEAKSDWEARYLMMNDAYLEQTGNLINCDLQMSSIRSWDLQHLEIKYEPRNAAK